MKVLQISDTHWGITKPNSIKKMIKKWFEKITDGTKVLYAETDIEYNGQKLYRKICNVD